MSTTFFLIWEFRDIAGWRLRQTHFGQPLRHFGGSLSITVFSFTHILDSRSAHFGQCLTTDTKAQRNPFFHSGQPAFRHFGVLLSTMSFTFLAFLAFNFSRFQLFSLFVILDTTPLHFGQPSGTATNPHSGEFRDHFNISISVFTKSMTPEFYFHNFPALKF